MTFRTSVVIAALGFAASTASAQASQPPAKKDDHAAHMQHGDHAASKWKELDAYHMLMMATWHPAKQNNDLAPARAKLAEMSTAAKAVAASKAPAACQNPELLKAQASLATETEKVAAMVGKKADDATLKEALKGLHDKFEVLEEGCNTGMKH
ncbi:MAG: hypothetical protein IBJ03_14020 [Gemmatimonadaceae bacterium]|nr:hypothetical protein [Gemmatimonadaceae bacterium]